MAELYVEVITTWYFENSPANASFYSDLKCDSFTQGRFTDSFTKYGILQVVGNAEITLSQFRCDLYEKYRDKLCFADVKRITRGEYRKAIRLLEKEGISNNTKDE